MITGIQHKGLKLLWTKNDGSKLPPAQIGKIRNILVLLDCAVVVEDVNFPGSGLHQLKGDLKGYWSITVTGNYRIFFKFEDGDVYLINYDDYH
ncbi:proteic killer suppression protein [Filimonas lacunae]|uniref:Proteic killer suppression protein n=1 Tax=Filimonas lacunae TaxID=477680 RepID=A0A173MC95_9BACT|nr:type II toxin-antitoxin system RelE/ParE family toxin [Filimonas lacunae]BAV05192.1 HigB toxin protein [Filimonas lacunae]SIT22713.1 proteic killer suppression protein [Filimonas lacunae]